jgi:hypothetical protein
MTDWQSIETAPKDGTIIIAAAKAEWVKAYDQFTYPLRSKFLDDKWQADFGDGKWSSYDPQPTHWKPAPEP